MSDIRIVNCAGLRSNRAATTSRRSFLKHAMAAAVSAGWCAHTNGAPASGAPEKSGERIRKAVKFAMITEDLSVLDKFKLLADLGFEGTEIHVTTDFDRRQVRKAIEATGVEVHGFLNSSLPDLKHAIDSAKYYGATSVLVVAGVVDQDNPYDRVYREQQQRLRAALPYAEQQGIKLLVENVWNNFLLSPLEMANYIDEFESSLVGAYFDVGNVVRYGWPEHWIAALGERIGKLDIKEYSRELQNTKGPGAGFGVEIGEGDCDWPAVTKALDEIGFEGWATAEVRGGDAARLRDIAQRMDQAFAR